MKKTICTLFLCICLCITFCGCGQPVSTQAFETNAFRIVRQVNNDGEIALAYIFPVNSSKLIDQGYDEKQIETYKFYLTSYVNALAKSNRERETAGVSVGSSQYFTDVDGIGFVIKFDNLESQKKFFGLENSSNTSSEKKSSGFFMKTTKLIANFPLSQDSAGDFKLVCLMAISAWANDQGLNELKKKEIQNVLNDAVYIYDFGSQQTALKSDIMYEDENFRHNVFIKTFAELKSGQEIAFWTSTPNYPVWYLSTFLFVIISMLIAYFVLKRKKISK